MDPSPASRDLRAPRNFRDPRDLRAPRDCGERAALSVPGSAVAAHSSAAAARSSPPSSPSLLHRLHARSHPVRQRRSRATRDRLIRAVEEVVREKGLAGATVRAIATRAGVSVGTIYRRFPNKRALIEIVRDRFLDGRSRRAARMLRSDRLVRLSPRTVLRRFINSALLDIERNRPLLEAFARESYPGAVVHGALADRLGRSAALELLVLALRGLVPAGSDPPAGPTPTSEPFAEWRFRTRLCQRWGAAVAGAAIDL